MKMSVLYKTEKNSNNQQTLPPIMAHNKVFLISKVKTNLNFSYVDKQKRQDEPIFYDQIMI